MYAFAAPLCRTTRLHVAPTRMTMTKAKQIDAEVRDYLQRTAEVNSPPSVLASLYRLRCEHSDVGLLTDTVVSRLKRFADVFVVRPDERVVEVDARLKTCEQRTEAVAGAMEALRDAKFIEGWRDELYPVVAEFHDAPFFLVERAAALTLGIKAYGVHINGYVQKANGLYMWVAKRSPTKPTWPSKLDHIAAGGQPFGVGLMENVIKECEEEAGIPRSLAEKAIATSAVSYASLQDGGVKQNVLFTYDLPLPEDFVPRPIDGEVASFSLTPISEVQQILRQTTDYKPNCAVVVIDFLLRHGFVSPDQNGYLSLLGALRRGSLS